MYTLMKRNDSAASKHVRWTISRSYQQRTAFLGEDTYELHAEYEMEGRNVTAGY